MVITAGPVNRRGVIRVDHWSQNKLAAGLNHEVQQPFASVFMRHTAETPLRSLYNTVAVWPLLSVTCKLL